MAQTMLIKTYRSVRRIRPRSIRVHHNILMPVPDVIERDDGWFQLGISDDAPAFPTRRFAEAVRLRQTWHQDIWLKQ
jgi:hypothetical protein